MLLFVENNSGILFLDVSIQDGNVIARLWDGIQWDDVVVKSWDGSQWRNVKFWDGIEWIEQT